MADEYTPVFDQKMARRMVVAANEGTELADTEFAQDIQTAPYGYLLQKYGQEVADNRRLYTQERAEVHRIKNEDRSGLQIAGDTALAGASGFVNVVGSTVGTGLAIVGAVDEYFDEEKDGISNYAVDYIDTIRRATEWIKSFQSQELADRRGLSGEAAQLDAEDNLAQYEADTADRDATFIDDLAWVGRGFMNNLGRIASDPAVAGDLVAEGLGSLGPSAKIASLASKAVTRTTTFQSAKIANAIAPTQGTRFLAMGAEGVNRAAIAATVGATEASGVYAQTVNEVLGMTHGHLLDVSPEYAEMIENDVDPDDAKTTLAANAGIDAFKTSFPMAASLGIIAGRFEAMPMKSFRGEGFIGGLRQVGAQTLEEGGQGATGQLATNVAIRDTGVDPNRAPGEGVDEALATGMIAGTGMAGVMATPSVFRRPDPKTVFETPEQVQRRIEAEKAGDAYTRRQYDMADNVAQSRMAFLEGKTDPMTEAELNEYEFLLDNSGDPSQVAKAYGLLNEQDQRPAPAAPERSQSPAGKAVSAIASAAATGLDAAQSVGEAAVNSRVGQATINTARDVTNKVVDTATPYVDSANEQVREFNNRPDRKAQSENLSILSNVAQLAETELTTQINANQSDTELNAELGRKSAVQSIVRTPASGPVPATFVSTTPDGSSNLSRVGGILTKLTEKGVRINKMSDGDVLYASQEMQNLRNAIPNLPAAIQAEVKKIIASEDFKNIQKRATRIDLNKTQDESKAITDEVVQETKAVAATNPANVNPVMIGKILEQDDRTDVTAKDIKIMKTAKRIGDAIKSRSEAKVEIQKNENVELSVKPEYRDGKKALPKIPLVEAISRNIVLGSGETRAPSVSEFASQIMQGSQSENGTVELDGVQVPVQNVVEHFGNFAQHMINKVEALNTSYRNRDTNGNGTSESFDNLGSDRKIRPGRTPNGAVQGKAMTYQGASPGGVRFAAEVYQDAVATVGVYNALAEAFPEQFPNGPVSVPDFAPNASQEDLSSTDVTQDEVIPVETEAAPTAVDEEVSPEADASEETQAAEEVIPEIETKNGYLQGDDGDLVFYHGTNADLSDGFADSENGIFLTTSLGEAQRYRDADKGRVIEARVKATQDSIAIFEAKDGESAQDVWLARTSELKAAAKGKDGILIIGSEYTDLRGNQKQDAIFVAFEGDKIDIINQDAEADLVPAVVEEYQKRLEGKKTKIVTATHEANQGMAFYSPRRGVISLDLARIQEDFEAGLTYLDGNGETTSEQKAVVFSNVDVDAFKVYIQNGGFEMYLKFIMEHELQHARQLGRGEVYPKDLMDPKAIAMERDANNAAFKAIEFTPVAPAGVPINERTFDNVNPKFNEGFQKRQNEISYADGDGILSMVQEQPGTEGYLEFVRLYKQELMDKANERLAKVKTNKSDTMTVKERILDGQDTTEYRRNKNTMMVDQTTGEYDQDLLSIAAVAVLDWLSGVRSTNPQSLPDTLEDMNLTYDMIGGYAKDKKRTTYSILKDIIHGVPPRDVAETLSKDIVRMWGLSVNRDAPMKDARGAIEGMVKELLESFIEMDTGMITKVKVPYFNTEAQKVVEQSMFNVFPVMKIQKAIGLEAQDAVKKMLAPELDTMPSIGAPSPFIDNTQARGDVKLTKREKKTLSRMQNQGHKLAQGLVGMVEALGLDELSTFLGKKDSSLLNERHPLRASIAGKNLSIERDYQEALSVVNAIRNSGFTLNGELPKVFYRVGISRVGRHQFKGINPQNNKILRALVTPTFATLNMDTQKHKNAFWLTVAQAADISGFNKVENQKHSFLLENIQNVFYERFGEAVEMAGEYLETGEMDGAAFVAAMGGSGEMQQLSAVFAVAALEKAIVDGTQNAFETSLSFELDGKTDGPGNMMANFGQGILTEMDFKNFQRVGFFLGTKDMTLNRFYGDGNEHDLYEVTSLQGQFAMYQEIANASPQEKERFHAVARFAVAFGDLETNDNGDYILTRKTSKNPMTKTVYGSSERGIGQGLAQDMTMKMYQELIANPDGITKYPGGKEAFVADFQLVYNTKFPANVDWNKSYLDAKSMKDMTDVVTKTLGKVLSDTAKNVIGDEITKVNDTLVLMTAFQTEFLTAKFEELLNAKVKDRAAKNKSEKPDRTAITQREYDEVINEIRKFSPVYANGMQTLDIGSLTQTDSGIKLSESMTGGFQMAAAMASPELAGVKVIPYVTQGRGDAMMMNWIYGSETAPEDTLQVFDGIDMPIDKIFEYAQDINAAVLQNWEADVLGDIVNDVTGFLDKAANDGELLLAAWERAYSNAKKKKTTAPAKSPEELISDIIEMHRKNQARKTVFKKIGISVDHMGGSDTAYVSGPDGRIYTLGQINDLIRLEMGEDLIANREQDGGMSYDRAAQADQTIDGDLTEIEADAVQIEDKREPVEGEFSQLVISDAEAIIDGLLRETRNKKVQAAVRILKKTNLKTRVIIGSPKEVMDWYDANIGSDGSVLRQDKKGIYDPVNDVMLITDNNHETLVHELIHAATFQQLENFYNGDQKHADTVKRLETLAQEFMDLEIDSPAANSAKAQIIALQAKDDAFSKAAALNEMMAWTLANDSLSEALSKEQTSVVKRMAKVLKALMQRLLGGVKADMLSNILFNTELLITEDAVVKQIAPPVDTGGGDELTPGAKKFTNFWIDLAKQRLEEANNTPGRRSEKLSQISDYRDNAQSALDTLDFGGFTFSAYQKETFKAIHMVLAMEMRLDTQSSAALNGMFKHVTDNLTPAMFGPTNEQDRYSAVMEIFGGTKNDEGVSDAIAVLLALSQTSRGFRAAIDQLPVPQSVENVSGDSLNEFLSSLTGMLMNKAVGLIDTSGQTVSETMDDLANSILKEESEKEFRILSGLMNNINKADAYMGGALKQIAGYTAKANEEVRASNRSKLTKISVGAIAAATGFLDQDRAEIQAEGLKRVTHMGTTLDFAMPVREFVTEMIGTDENNRNVVALLDEATYAASSVRQNYREDLPVILQDEFENHPDAEQWKATHKVLGRTDFSAVYDENHPNASFKMFKDENIIDTKISQAEAALRANFSNGTANVVLEKAQQLADFMNGKGPGHMLWRNAYAINMMAGDYQPGMTGEIDALVSLYAMKGSDPQMRQEITRMYEADPLAMQNLAVYLKGLNKEEDMKTISDVAHMNGYKGYVPDLGQQGTKMIIAKDEDRRDLEKKGYKRVADATADDSFSSIKRGYYVTSTKQTGTYSQGVMQIIQDTFRGVDATTGLSVNGATAGVITGTAVEIVTDNMNQMTNGLADNKEALLPIYDVDGVLHYERYMNPDIIEKFTAPKSNLALMLGAWAGRQVEEKFSQQYNFLLIDELKRIHDIRGEDDDGLFVNLPELAAQQKAWDEATVAERRKMTKPDRVFVESWNVISPQTKRYIEEVFGKDEFYVRKDQMNVALGYRDPSVVDMWTGNTRVPEALREGVQAITGAVMGKDAMKVMAGLEGGIQGVVSTAKDLIVVRSLVVPYMNTQANVVQLSTRGIPVKQQFEGYKNKLAEIEQFNENRTAIMKLDTRIQLAGTDANKVRILEGQRQVILDQNARMSIAPLIEAGAYKNISEGITELDVDITSGRVGEWIENQVNKLPGGVQTVAKYGILSKDTAIYKGANKAVQYGDFIAKSIYYDHLIGKGMSHADAMKLVNEEFVNFSVLPGRTRSYLEGIGATWFLTFKIRIMKIAMNQVRENPARSMILAATIADYGSPQADNLASVIADDRIGYALGWEMLFGSAGLNPWLNLYD